MTSRKLRIGTAFVALALGLPALTAATPGAAHVNHLYRAVMEANEYPGPAVVVVYTPCQPEHGIADDASSAQSRLAVDSRAWPLLTYDPRRGASLAERLSLQGNPALREDWLVAADGSVTDFLAFARSEGRFAPHFANGEASPEIKATMADRLADRDVDAGVFRDGPQPRRLLQLHLRDNLETPQSA